MKYICSFVLFVLFLFSSGIKVALLALVLDQYWWSGNVNASFVFLIGDQQDKRKLPW